MTAQPDRTDPHTPPLVGREREQATLRAALDAALNGHGALVLIGGEAGIGKTALAEEICREGGGLGALVLVGRCYDLAETPPYGPWLEITAQYAGAGSGLSPLPAAVIDRDALAAVASQAALFDQVVGWFAAVAAARPLVMLLDDLHWADPASLDLLRAVARRAPALPLLVLVTYRSDELTRRHPLYALLPVLEREAHAGHLDLRRLDAAGVRDLVAARHPLRDADASRLVAWLFGRAEGNAFFTAQLLRALEEGGVLTATNAGWTLGDLGPVALPAPLRQVLETRVARLGEEARRLLTLAAVIGQEVPLALWATVAETDEDGLLDTIERAVDAHLITESPDGSAVRFAHALIREALYEGHLALRRRRVHRLVGEVLAATPGPDPDIVADHFRRAGDARAYDWLVRAGERAHRAYAWVTAAERFESALALLDEDGPETEARVRLLLRLAILRRYADPRRAIEYVDEAARWATRTSNAPLAAITVYYRGLLRCIAGDPRRGVAEMAAGIEAIEALPPHEETRRRTLATAVGFVPGGERGTLAMLLGFVGRYAEARVQGERAVAGAPEPAAAVGHGGSSYADAYHALMYAGAMMGEPEEARRAYERARGLYRAVGHLIHVGNTARNALTYLALPYHADELAWRQYLADEADVAFIQSGEAFSAYVPGLARAPLFLVEGRWDMAAVLGEQVSAFPSQGNHYHPTFGELARARGDADASARVARGLPPGGPTAEPGDATNAVTTAHQRLAVALALDEGDLPAARVWLEAHDRWLAWSGAVLGRAEGQLAWAAYHRAAGDLAQSRLCAERAREHATAPRQPLALLAAWRLLGELATASGEHTSARTHLDAALALADACAAPYERALTLLALAELHAARGDRDAATTPLADARSTFATLRAQPALARADALAARLAAAPVAALPFGLTAREAEVLRLIAAGLTDPQIAERLFVSRHTVNAHTRAIYGKLGVTSRAAATRLATERGLA